MQADLALHYFHIRIYNGLSRSRNDIGLSFTVCYDHSFFKRKIVVVFISYLSVKAYGKYTKRYILKRLILLRRFF